MSGANLMMAAMVWYVPGWLRAQRPQEGALEAVSDAFPNASVEFKAWDGDTLVWNLAVDTADRESWRLAFEIATMPEAERKGLTLVGHSLGGRMAARTLARLAEKGIRIRQAVLMAAAIPYDDPDLAAMGAATEHPVISICNPDDVTLRYVYTLLGGERTAAYGANGTLVPVDNVIECVTPSNITGQVKLEPAWAKSDSLKEVANHHALFYLGYLKRILTGEKPSGEVMVPQDFVTLPTKVIDAGLWWDDVECASGWKLEGHKVANVFRIISPDRRCTAWGGEETMRAAFAKVRSQLCYNIAMNDNPMDESARKATLLKIGDAAAESAQGGRFAEAFRFLRRPDLGALPAGRYAIDGERVFAMVSDVTLKPAGAEQTAEFHRRYADVQSPLTGEEAIGLPELPDSAAKGPFDAERDIAFFQASCPLRTVRPGECLVIPPGVAHAPGLTEGDSKPLRKVVVKVEW